MKKLVETYKQKMKIIKGFKIFTIIYFAVIILSSIGGFLYCLFKWPIITCGSLLCLLIFVYGLEYLLKKKK